MNCQVHKKYQGSGETWDVLMDVMDVLMDVLDVLMDVLMNLAVKTGGQVRYLAVTW